jgi:hypothetical protein
VRFLIQESVVARSLAGVFRYLKSINPGDAWHDPLALSPNI